MILEWIRKFYLEDFKDKIEEFLKKNYFRDIKFEVLVESFGYNIFYFSKFFKKIFGENFLFYVEKVRIEKVKEFLKSGEKVFEVVRKVGYEDIDYFCLRFRRYMGCLLKEYKVGNKNEEKN